MPWYAWVALGTLLLATELFGVPAEFFLVFLGVSALAVGGLAWLDLGLGVTAQWALFGAFAAVSLVVFRKRMAARPGTPQAARVDDTLVGERGVASDSIAADGAGRVELRGVPWQARNAGRQAIAPGAPVRVERVEGLTLFVVAD
jgi:membrane protein implicated in regulation of membrane protease activity